MEAEAAAAPGARLTKRDRDMPARHLVTIWNPAYAADAMEVHQRILRAAAEACREKQCDEDDVYVWWAKRG